MTGKVPILTIDGPSGAGKGTIARRVAHALEWHLLDSGALYRLVALAARSAGLDPANEAAHEACAAALSVRFSSTSAGEEQIWLAGKDVTSAIRTERAGDDASRVAVMPGVRKALVNRQRDFAQPPGLVADGRDMGTVIFPNADCKIFLSAAPDERARRRHKQLKDKGLDVSLAALSREIAERDQRDLSRTVAPLVPASDALILDTTSLSIDAVVERVLSAVHERVG